MPDDATAPDPAEPELSHTEAELLRLIRAGTVDAEVAVRLGVSHGDVKRIAERLVIRFGLPDREALRSARLELDAAPEAPAADTPEALPRRARSVPVAQIAGLLAGVLLAVAAVAVLVGRQPGSGDEQGDGPAITQVAMDGYAMLDLGKLFVGDGASEPVSVQEAGEAAVVVALAAPVRVPMAMDHFTWQPIASGGMFMAIGAVNGHGFLLTVRVISGGPLGPVLDGSVAIAADPENPTRLDIRVTESDHGASLFHHTIVTSSGELLVSNEPIHTLSVLDSETKAGITTRPGTLIGTLAYWTYSGCTASPCHEQ